MVSVLYIIISALIIGYLALTVIKARRKYKIRAGDGDIQELQFAIAAHSNAVENLPIGMLLLVALELNTASLLVIHLLGLALMVGRVIHAKAMLVDNLKYRVIGMQITFFTLVVMVAMNVVYLPYAKLIQF